MDERQQKELLEALIDLRRRVTTLERKQTLLDKILPKLEDKVDDVVNALAKVVLSTKQAYSRVVRVTERIGLAEAAIRNLGRK
jgi:ribosomal protein L17